MKKFLKFLLCLIAVLGITGCDLKRQIIVPKDKEKSSTDDKKEEEKPSPTPVTPDIPAVDWCASDAAACLDTSGYTPGEVLPTLSAAYNTTVKSVVSVLSYVPGDELLSLGSGVIYAKSTDNKSVYIYTNAHVVSGRVSTGVVVNVAYYEVIYYNNSRVQAELLAMDGSEDVAILKADIEPDNDFAIAKIGNEEGLSVGESIYTIGSPYSTDYRNTLTSGVVSGLNVLLEADNDYDGETTKLYLTQIDAALSSGNSGGPLFNMAGEVVGLNVLKILNSNNNVVESMNYSLRISHVVKVANSILKDGKYARPLIGVNVYTIGDLSLKERETLNVPSNVMRGLLIESVVETGASVGKLHAGEIIISINSQPCSTFAEFVVELLKFDSGEDVTLNIRKTDGTYADVVITLK